MARSPRRRFVVIFAVLFLLVAGTAGGTFFYLLTRDLPAHWQDPNRVELIEADRKLKLLNEALAEKTRGFVRLSEVEINSFIEDRYSVQTNSTKGEGPGMDRAVVLLTSTNLTLVTWVTKPLFGRELPLVWHRSLAPVQETNGWRMVMTAMRVGELNIPPRFWSKVEAELSGADGVFEERKVWLAQIPTVAIMRNEVNQKPELRLYTYVPESKDLR